MYELREEVFKFSKEGGKCGDWVIWDLWTVIDNIRIGAQLLGLLWGAMEGGMLGSFHRVLRGVYDWGVSMWNSTADNIAIAFSSFVVGRVVSATKGAFCWGIPAFRAIRTVVLATTFDARIGPVAVSSRVSVLLAACALRNVILVCSGWFNVYGFVLNGCYFVNFFIVLGRFKIYEK